MRGRVFLTAAYHRDTGAAHWTEAYEMAQTWTYRGTIERKDGMDYEVTDAVIRNDNGGTKIEMRTHMPMSSQWGEDYPVEVEGPGEDPCPDVVLPWHSVRLIEVDG